MRVLCTTLESFEICKEYNIWAATNNLFKQWCVGDVLIFRVEGKIAGYAKMTGLPFKSDLIYWSNEVYPNRVPIGDWNLLNPQNWIEVNNEIKEFFLNSWGDHYGLKLIKQMPMGEADGDLLLKIINEKLKSQ